MITDIHIITSLLRLLKEIGGIQKEITQKYPFSINVIDLSVDSKVKETAHSAILHRLLCNSHILQSFISSIIGETGKTIDTEAIRPREKDHMDISIYDNDSCIIIENKINDADDQTGQIYRYVEEARRRYSDGKILVLYLTSDHTWKPSDKSLTQNGEGIERIPKVIEEKIIIKDYKHDIYSWLNDLLDNKLDNSILNSAILQYRDYLEILFKMKPQEKEIKQKTREAIIKVLFSEISSKETSDEDVLDYKTQVSVLKQYIDNIDSLKDELEQSVAFIKTKQYEETINEKLSDLNLTLQDLRSKNLDELGMQLKFPEVETYLTYGYEYSKVSYYIGIYTPLEKINTKFESIQNIWNSKFKDNDWRPITNWPLLKYLSEDQLVTEFLNIVEAFRQYSIL